MSDRMFRVIVLGGIGLTACGGAVRRDVAGHEGSDAAAASAVSPVDTGGVPAVASDSTDASHEAGFPSELPTPPAVAEGDASGSAEDASVGSDGASGDESADGSATGEYEDAAADGRIITPIEAPR